jgi:hypothetical protein
MTISLSALLCLCASMSPNACVQQCLAQAQRTRGGRRGQSRDTVSEMHKLASVGCGAPLGVGYIPDPFSRLNRTRDNRSRHATRTPASSNFSNDDGVLGCPNCRDSCALGNRGPSRRRALAAAISTAGPSAPAGYSCSRTDWLPVCLVEPADRVLDQPSLMGGASKIEGSVSPRA